MAGRGARPGSRVRPTHQRRLRTPALAVADRAGLDALYERVASWPDVVVEFALNFSRGAENHHRAGAMLDLGSNSPSIRVSSGTAGLKLRHTGEAERPDRGRSAKPALHFNGEQPHLWHISLASWHGEAAHRVEGPSSASTAKSALRALQLKNKSPHRTGRMTQKIQITVMLLAVIAAVAVVAARLKIPPAVLLVVTGVGLALAPGLPAIVMAPEFVLLIVLPPLIYWSAVAMSWRDFRSNLRPISLLAVGCVLFTTVAVAWAGHVLVHLSWPVGFVLGAVVSPPDPVAAPSIARRLGLPRRLIVILQGEALSNDATALVLYRFAVMAVSVGTFSFTRATGIFAAIVAGEILWGIGVGWVLLRLRRLVGDTGVEILLSIITPRLAARRFSCPRHCDGGTLHQLECPGLDWRRRAPGHLLLGFCDLTDRESGIPGFQDRDDDRRDQRLSCVRTCVGRRGRQRRRS